MPYHRQLLDYTKSAVTRNKSEKKINSLLDYVSASPNMQLLQDFYATTLSALQASRPGSRWRCRSQAAMTCSGWNRKGSTLMLDCRRLQVSLHRLCLDRGFEFWDRL